MEFDGLPWWLSLLAGLFWLSVVAWRWAARFEEWRSIAGLSLVVYLALLVLLLGAPPKELFRQYPILTLTLFVSVLAAALGCGTRSRSASLVCWLLAAAGPVALAAMSPESGSASYLLLLTCVLAGAVFPWWVTPSETNEQLPRGVAASDSGASSPWPVAISLTLISIGVWAPLYLAARGETGIQSPSAQRSALPRWTLRDAKSPVNVANSPPFWSRPGVLALMGVIGFAGLTSSFSITACKSSLEPSEITLQTGGLPPTC